MEHQITVVLKDARTIIAQPDGQSYINVIDFGVFVDIGVHQDGLVHISQITDRYIKHPLEAVSVGDIVDVQVLTVDVAKKRIGLTMKIQKQ